jgi:hypothetical protein
MSDLRNILKEEYNKKANAFSLTTLLEMVEEVMSATNAIDLKEGPRGARERERVIRLPNVMPTEITVGQKPGSEDRQQFQLWMSNIGMSGDASSSAINQKLTALTNFFDNPKENLKGTTIPETLSYLMFLNQFVYMLKEFNASVAGFLWEPFLAALFGGKSRQVPTSEGDIADIRIDEPGADRNKPISLKILNEVGVVKGSFYDLVAHFAGADGKPPGTEMRYIIVVKQQTEKEKDVSGVTFYEFNITADNFFEWIGHPLHRQTFEVRSVTFTLADANKKGWLKVGGAQVSRAGPTGTGNYIWIRTAKTLEKRRSVSPDWVRIGSFVKGPDGPVAQLSFTPEVQERLQLSGIPEDGVVVPDTTKLKANIAQFKAGGVGGATLVKGYEAIPGTESKDTKELWGGKDEMAKWADFAAQLKETGQPPSVFFSAVLGNDPGIPWPGQAAPGARRGGEREEKGGTQFHITPNHYKGLGGKLGTLRITTQAVEKFFEEAAATMNEELITMFNKLADLNDNIGRFFLANCGQSEEGVEKCTDKDAARRTEAGQNAMNDAKELEDAVIKSVSGMTEG